MDLLENWYCKKTTTQCSIHTDILIRQITFRKLKHETNITTHFINLSN